MLFKLQVDIVWSASGERCQPHVGVILSAIHSIDQVSHNTWVSAVFMENIDVARVRTDLTHSRSTHMLQLQKSVQTTCQICHVPLTVFATM